MIESSTYSGQLPQIAGEIATGVLGGVAGGVVGNLDINLDISTSTSPQVWSTGYGGFVYTQGNTVHSSLGSYYKNGSVDPSLPANPDDLLKRPGWKETTHPDAGKKGHRTFENEKTGEIIRHDQGKPGQPGHKAQDHYHHQVPNGKGGYNYVDGKGNPVPPGSNQAHLYPNTTNK